MTKQRPWYKVENGRGMMPTSCIDEVIVYIGDADTVMTAFHENARFYWKSSMTKKVVDITKRVTAWMPLPYSPKPGEYRGDEVDNEQ